MTTGPQLGALAGDRHHRATVGYALISLGSAGNVSALLDTPLVDEHSRLHTGCYVDNHLWIATAVQQTVGLAFRWLTTTLGVDASALEQVLAQAASVQAATTGLILLPHLNGQRNPRYDPNTRGVLFGITLTTTPAQIVRAVIEGIAFAQREAIDALSELNVPVSQLAVVGGGARSALWRQILADDNNLPVTADVGHERGDGSALGAAMLAALHVGYSDSTERAHELHDRSIPDPLEPHHAKCTAYQQAFAEYQRITTALDGCFQRPPCQETRIPPITGAPNPGRDRRPPS